MNQVTSRIVAAALAGLLVPSAAFAAGSASRPDVVNTRVDHREVRNPASELLGARIHRLEEGSRIDFSLNGEAGSYEVLELRNPARLAIDLLGVSKAPSRPGEGDGKGIAQIRFGAHPDKVRVVVDLAGEMPAYRLEREGKSLRLHLGPAARAEAPALAAAPAAARPAAPAPAVAKAADPAPKAAPAKAADPAPKAAASKAGDDARLVNVAFEQKGDVQEVQLHLSRKVAYEVERPNPHTAVLSLAGAELPKELNRSLDASAFGGPVRTISSFRDGKDGKVRVVVALAEPSADQISVRDKQILWRFRPAGSATIIDEAGAVTRVAADTVETTSARRPRYTGKRISFEFKDIDIHNLLRVIAEVSEKNIVVTDDVKGYVTIRLRNVPWDQALDLVLKVKGLGMEETGNIIRIAPLPLLEKERDMMARAELAKERAAPLKIRIIPVNYALAAELEPKLKGLMTPRGSLTVDARTNTLILRDVEDVIERAEQLVRTLDTQTPQVLIAARIVEVSSNFSRDLGVQWGGNLAAASAYGNATGLSFPNSAIAAGGVPGEIGAGGAVPAAPNWAVSFPAGVGPAAGSGIGFTFGSAGGAAQLNLRLTAMETKGMLKTVSAPKVTTLDNREAVIGQGVSIPFSQVSAAGVNTVFIDAKLELRVTPHVTADGSVLMKIRATNNQPADNVRGANGQPGLIKREANTEVLVKDGDTTVIGGIFVRKTSESVSQVPLLGDIPILGWLFKSRVTGDDRTELMIFISPTIVNRDASLVAGG